MSDQPQEAPLVSVRVNNGGEQYTPVGNIQVATAPEDSIQSTLRSPSGSRLMGNVTDDCRVTIDGVEMTISQAQDHGLVSLEDGQLSEHETPVIPGTQEGPDEALDINGNVVDSLENWSSAIESYTGSSQPSYAVVAEFMADPSRLPALLQTMAEEQGHDPAAFHQEAQRISTSIDGALNERLGSMGVDPHAFGEWVHRNVPAPELNRAIANLVVTGEFSPVRAIIQKYQRSVPSQMDDPHAGVSVEVNGQRIETTVANALRNGWL